MNNFIFSSPLNIEVVVQSLDQMNFDKKDITGFIFQYPDTEGSIVNVEEVIQNAKKNKVGSFNQVSIIL